MHPQNFRERPLVLSAATATSLRRAVEREVQVWRRLWRGSVGSDFIVPLLFLGAIGLGLGGLVTDRSGDVEGVSYLEFVTPGFLALGCVLSSVGESLWPVLGGARYQRFYHGMVATPLSPVDVYRGLVAWNGLRGVLKASSFLVVATLMGGVASPWAVLAVPGAVLSLLAFSAPLAAYAATQEDDSSFAVILRLGVGPLMVVSGTFFPVDQLPAAVRPLSWLSPLWHGAELCRDATTGSWEPLAALVHVAFLLACTALGLRWGARTFTRRLAP